LRGRASHRKTAFWGCLGASRLQTTLCFRQRLDPAELRRNGDVAKQNGNPLRLDILVPVFMSCALLWWVSRGMSWLARLVVTVITLAAIICIVLFERSGLF
jgi:hypothetical protein